MYAVIDSNNKIVDFDNRSIPIEQLLPEELHNMYIDISNHVDLKIGDIWNCETKEWIISDISMSQDNDDYAVSNNQYQPSTSEIAQMISDLQADLIIAGVI